MNHKYYYYDRLTFNESVSKSNYYERINDRLILQELINDQTNHAFLKDTLSFKGDINYSFNNKHVTVSDTLIFNQNPRRTISVHLAQQLDFDQAINPPIVERLFQHLFFQQTINYVNTARTRSLQDSLAFHQNINYIVINPNISMQSQGG